MYVYFKYLVARYGCLSYYIQYIQHLDVHVS